MGFDIKDNDIMYRVMWLDEYQLDTHGYDRSTIRDLKIDDDSIRVSPSECRFHRQAIKVVDHINRSEFSKGVLYQLGLPSYLVMKEYIEKDITILRYAVNVPNHIVTKLIHTLGLRVLLYLINKTSLNKGIETYVSNLVLNNLETHNSPLCNIDGVKFDEIARLISHTNKTGEYTELLKIHLETLKQMSFIQLENMAQHSSDSELQQRKIDNTKVVVAYFIKMIIRALEENTIEYYETDDNDKSLLRDVIKSSTFSMNIKGNVHDILPHFGIHEMEDSQVARILGNLTGIYKRMNNEKYKNKSLSNPKKSSMSIQLLNIALTSLTVDIMGDKIVGIFTDLNGYREDIKIKFDRVEFYKTYESYEPSDYDGLNMLQSVFKLLESTNNYIRG